MGLRGLLLPLLLAFAPMGAAAQDAPARAQVQSSVLTMDADRLLAETRFGQRLSSDLRQRTEALAAENERLRAELTAEERNLTERRPEMEVEAFRAQADAFDARVQRIRAEQDAKQQALEASVEEGRQRFLTAVTPVLGRLMIESGAVMILERRDAFLSASSIDVTEEAIAAIDAQLGDGTGAGSTVEEPPPVPEEAPVEQVPSRGETPAEPAAPPVDPAPETRLGPAEEPVPEGPSPGGG